MGNGARARLPGRPRDGAGPGPPRLPGLGPLRGGAAIKRSGYCATQQGARRARWKRPGSRPAYQPVNKARWPGQVLPSLPARPRSPRADQAERQIWPAGFPSAVTTLLLHPPPPAPPTPPSTHTGSSFLIDV